MSEAIAASGTVHWIGAGLSTGSGLRVLCDRARRVLVWARSTERAGKRLAQLGLAGRAEVRTYDPSVLADELGAGDVLVSMLPAGEHADLLRLCIERRAHFACSSYVSADILAAVPAAQRVGVAVLTEAGLDPGIDHLFADLLVERARAVLGEGAGTAEFVSYCGGVPATANEFRYRFSWAPHGVLNALRAPSRFIADGVPQVADRPWEATRPFGLDGEAFEVYPNRDSIPYIQQYAFPPSWRVRTFVRGTLRLDGWQQAWADVFAVLRTGDDRRIAALAEDLAARHPTTENDRDRVVLVVGLTVHADHGAAWSGRYLLDMTGTASESAMARCVSLPLAFGVTEIMAGRTPAGLRQAAQSAEGARRWLAFLTGEGIPCRLEEIS
ncbi:saccharopine dehydrogenase family protein [Micromonospora sp. CPCC 206060]|uniref:saccharopine dehydrogenase family protein n=1 Tax=Micromonospora sp. CPCC 206060 TaxID=3122406 RepID=UPI002FEF8435